jgi:S-adenosylmethionine hydrolase
MGVITLVTDFGADSGYPAAMKGVIYSIAPTATVIDISHGILRHHAREGAFLLWMTAAHFPQGTVHCAVVDPGVGTARAPLTIRSGGQLFVGPDNGLLVPAARRLGSLETFVITNERFFRKPVSRTFHGRDIFAPIAAHLANGFPPEELGERIEKFAKLNFGEGVRQGSTLTGEILFIDSFGNLVTNISSALLRDFVKPEERVTLESGSKSTQARFLETYGQAQENELFVTVGSHDQTEIAVNLGNAAQRLRARPTESLTLRQQR